MLFQVFIKELAGDLYDQDIHSQLDRLDRLEPCFIMLPLYDVLDYLQAITPNFVKRFCHYTITNFYADLKNSNFKRNLQEPDSKKLRRAANIKTFQEIKNFLFTCFLWFQYRLDS